MDFSAQNFEIKGSFKSVIGKLFLFIFGFLSVFVLLILFIKPNLSFDFGGKLLLLIGIFFVAFVLWIKSYRITLSGNNLSYKSVFQNKVLIAANKIKRVKYQSSGSNFNDRKTKIYPKILLYPLSRGEEGLIEITLNVFNNNDLQKFYDLLEAIDKFPFKRNVRKK